MNEENEENEENDRIEINGLRVASRIGAGEDERGRAQSLEISIAMTPARSLDGVGDVLERTVDYQRVAGRVRDHAATGERRLIETLAEEVAELVLTEFEVAAVRVRVDKFVLPDTRGVAVVINRRRGD